MMRNDSNFQTPLIHKNDGLKKRKKIYIHDVRIYILIIAAFWWLLLATINSLELSLLQVEWSIHAAFAIYVYIPFCFLICIIPIRRSPYFLSILITNNTLAINCSNATEPMIAMLVSSILSIGKNKWIPTKGVSIASDETLVNHA